MAERVGPVCRKELADMYFQNNEVRGTLLHTATRAAAWPDWEKETGVTIKHAGNIRFEHFYQSLQAAVSGAGIAMGPLALVADDIAAGALVAPRGFIADGTDYILMTPTGKANHPVFEALLEWLRNTARETESIANVHEGP
ncbi:LysR substrate-binding domain-containing protein [Yersinia sp. J1]|uniref:LysR substrate-binding domain-containing protein n=1 Tax=Yersinia sp. J1 TaxID=3424774 RepID=UPI003D35B2C3